MNALKEYQSYAALDDRDDRAIERVLVVDDSRAHRTFLSSILKKQGFQVLEADGGMEALATLKANHVDLILSDWMMPGMNGLDLCREVRALALDRYIYFILLTGRTDKGAVSVGLNVGADDFLSKPIVPDELRARISAGDRILKMERELGRKNKMISNALDEISALYDAVNRDLVEARKMQQGLVRDRYHDFGCADVSLLLKPSGHVGGDLVGCFQAEPKRVAVYSIDVSGHGIASALLTARLASVLSDGAPGQNIALISDQNGGFVGRPPQEVATLLNILMLEEMKSDLYFTIAFGYLDLETGRVDITQCGHPNPLIIRPDDTADFFGQNGMPIGLLDEAEFSQYHITLRPGERLLFYSDGFPECTGHKGELLGDDGFRSMVARNAELQGNDFLEALVWDLDMFCGTTDFPDDLSCAMIEYHGPQKGL